MHLVQNSWGEKFEVMTWHRLEPHNSNTNTTNRTTSIHIFRLLAQILPGTQYVCMNFICGFLLQNVADSVIHFGFFPDYRCYTSNNRKIYGRRSCTSFTMVTFNTFSWSLPRIVSSYQSSRILMFLPKKENSLFHVVEEIVGRPTVRILFCLNSVTEIQN